MGLEFSFVQTHTTPPWVDVQKYAFRKDGEDAVTLPMPGKVYILWMRMKPSAVRYVGFNIDGRQFIFQGANCQATQLPVDGVHTPYLWLHAGPEELEGAYNVIFDPPEAEKVIDVLLDNEAHRFRVRFDFPIPTLVIGP